MLSVQRNSGVDWDSKEPKGFFRGRDSRQERLDLVRFSKNHSDLIDAGLTNYFFFRDQEQQLGRSKHISFFEFFKVCKPPEVPLFSLQCILFLT